MSDQSDGPAGNPLGGMDLGGLLERMEESSMVVERIPADSPAYRFLV